ncbi:MAG: hypothetical protein IVW54_19640 [Candidatus Binataceae bacterium]|nr:hypothetical protein [Candidatus Binataceae bacterium]
MASGNATPARVILGQHTKLTRVAHGIVYDRARDEVFASAPLASAIVAFKSDQRGDTPPLRVIQGPHTMVHDPWGLAVDDKHNELLAADFEQGAILTFPIDGNGDVAPRRVIRGPRTQMFGVSGVAVDPERNLIVAMTFASGTEASLGDGGIFIFDRKATGNVAPIRMIAGPHTGIISGWHVAVYEGKIYAVASNIEYRPPYDGGGYGPRNGCKGPPFGMLTAPRHLGFVGIWNITDNGDIPPRAIIRGSTTELVEPGGIVLDPADGEIFVTEPVKGAIFGFMVPELFGRGS